jgi:hypothetical protein
MLYGIDEDILNLLRDALETQDAEQVYNVIDLLTDRTEGKCFCAAHCASECICGAWDGDWNDDGTF